MGVKRLPIPIAYSGAIWAAIPTALGQPFRRHWGSGSGDLGSGSSDLGT